MLHVLSQANLSTTDGADVRIDVQRRPAMGIVSIKLDAIGVAIIPLLDDDAPLPLADVGLDSAADRKAELIGDFTGLKALLQKGNIEVLANEDESAPTLFIRNRLPRFSSGFHAPWKFPENIIPTPWKTNFSSLPLTAMTPL